MVSKLELLTVPFVAALLRLFRGPSAWDWQWCTDLAHVPSDPVVESCGLSGRDDRSDRDDLLALCAAQAKEPFCSRRASLASSRSFGPNGLAASTRRRRQNLLALPEEARGRACGGQAGSQPGEVPFLNIIVMHDGDNACRFNVHSEWMTSVLFPAFGLPLRVVQSEPAQGASLAERPVLNNSIVVVSAFHGTRFDVGAYGRLVRQRGARGVGLFHYNHEVTWETEGHEDLYNFVTYRNTHYLQDYGHFDFVLRFHYSPAYARASTYLPLGPTSSFLPSTGDAFPDVPNASQRASFCVATVGGSDGNAHTSYRMDRQVMHIALRASGGACAVTSGRGPRHRAQLLAAAFSLCPFGTQQETSRLWESVLAGAIVVMTNATFVHRELQAPFVVLGSWFDLAPTLAKLREDPAGLDALQQRQQAWFASYMRGVRAKLRALGAAHFRPELGG